MFYTLLVLLAVASLTNAARVPQPRILANAARAPQPHMLANAVTNGLATGAKFCLNVKLCVKPERRQEFIDCITANQKGTLSSEPLALDYVWGESQDEPNTFHFYEKYEGKVGFEAHTQTEHFAAWEEFASTEPFTSPPVVEFYEEM